MIRKIISVILCLILVLTLGACWDARELNTRIFAYMIGVDKGVADKLRFTVMLPTLTTQAGGGGTQGGTTSSIGGIRSYSIDCPTLISGLNLIDTFISRRINYSHAKFLIIGEDMAKEGITTFMQGMRIPTQIRMTMNVVVVRGKASDFIEAFTPMEGHSIPRTLEGLASASAQTGLIDRQKFIDVLHDLMSSKKQASCILGAVNKKTNTYPEEGDPVQGKFATEYMPGELPRKGGNPIELLGAAVFKGDKLVGELNLGETRALLMVKGTYLTGAYTIPDPLEEGSFITIQTKKHKNPEIKVSTSGDVPVISLKVFYEGEIEVQQSLIPYDEKKYLKILEKTYAETIADSIAKTIAKCQQLGSDVFGFGDHASKNFWTLKKWEAYNWLERFADAQVKIEARMIIKNTSAIIDYNPVRR
ncbi:MAG TPA: Ger(x)C family spore germination protein [Clostridia bacterium]|nr:Ger(x)C family spore germination protein [Clostridia bacterium]